jgi:3-oxoacyl-[acyl-carrier protein] reductase
VGAFGIEGMKVLVTASTKGIGFGISKVLLENGANVVINGRTQENVSASLEKLGRLGAGKVYGIAADITKREEAVRLVKEASQALGGLDSLVYVTGPPKPGKFSELSFQDWEAGVDLLIKSALVLAKESITYLEKSERPSMVFLTSVAVKEPIPNIALSNVLRISIHGLVKTLSRELAAKGIRVNAVLPGHIETERAIQLALDRAQREGKSLDDVLRETAREIPLGRLGKPEEIGYAVAFLISPFASYITGTFLPVDGGILRSL